MSQSTSSLISVALVTGLSFAHLALQFVFQVLLAKWFGADRDMDCFAAAQALPTVLSSILTGSLGYVFVPVFVQRRHEGRSDLAWSLVSSLAVWVTVVSVAIAAAIALSARWLVDWMQPGFAEDEQQLTAQLLAILVWLAPLNGLTSVLHTIYHAEHRFATPALASLAGMVATIAVGLASVSRLGIYGVSVAVVAGAVVLVGLQLPVLIRRFDRRAATQIDQGMRRAMWLAWPLILGAAYYNFGPVIDRYFASSLSTGSIAHLGYAWRISNAVLVLTVSGLSVVVFPQLSRHAAARDTSAFCGEVAHALRFLMFLLTPMLMGLVWFAEPLVGELFERGRFTAADTRAVAALILLYGGVIAGASVGEIAAKAFYALQQPRLPVIVGVCGFTLGIVLKAWWVQPFGVQGIVAATSVYYLVIVSANLGILARRMGPRIFEGGVMTLARSLAASAVALAGAEAVFRTGAPFAACAAVASCVPLYAVLSWLLGDEFAVRAAIGLGRWKRRLTNRGA